jgi:hypothetical protein
MIYDIFLMCSNIFLFLYFYKVNCVCYSAMCMSCVQCTISISGVDIITSKCRVSRNM